MDVRFYQYMLTIAEEGSVQAAAEKLHLSQSALSQALVKEETEAGGIIFERKRGKKITITPLGELYLKTASQMVRIKEETYDLIKKLDHNLTETIRIAICNQAYVLISENIMEVLHSEFPSLNIFFYKADSSQSLELLKNGVIDLAIFAAQEVRDSVIKTDILYSERLVLAVSSGYEMNEEEDILNQLEKIPFIYPAYNTFLYQLIPERLHEESLPHPAVYKSADASEIVRIVENGYGAALVPEKLIPEEHTCTVIGWDPKIRYNIYAAIPKYHLNKDGLVRIYHCIDSLKV